MNPSVGPTLAEFLAVAVPITAALVGAVVALWRLDRGQLVERLKEALAEAEKNEIRYEQATKLYHAAVAELAATKIDVAREQGRREARSSLPPPLPLPPPPPSRRGSP